MSYYGPKLQKSDIIICNSWRTIYNLTSKLTLIRIYTIKLRIKEFYFLNENVSKATHSLCSFKNKDEIVSINIHIVFEVNAYLNMTRLCVCHKFIF